MQSHHGMNSSDDCKCHAAINKHSYVTHKTAWLVVVVVVVAKEQPRGLLPVTKRN
jgi:hypothetical protein